MATRKVGGELWSDESGQWKKLESKARKDSQGNYWVDGTDGVRRRASAYETKMIEAGGGSTNLIENLVDNKSTIDKRRKFKRERTLELRGEAAKQRAEVAKETPKWKRAMLSVADEAKSLYHGSKDIAHEVRLMNDELGSEYPGVFEERGEDEILQDIQQTGIRKDKRSHEKKMYKEMEEETGLEGLANMSIYLPTGMIGKVPEKAITKGLEMFRKAANGKVKHGTNATGRKAFAPEFASDLIIGGLEGAAHEDETIFDGMTSSAIGSTTGKLYAPKLEKAAINDSRYPTSVVEDFVKKGYIANPGMRTGNVPMQEYFSRRSKRPTLKNKYASVKANNDEVLLNEILEATGIKADLPDGVGIGGIRPEQLDNYMKIMGREFDELEASSSGIIPSNALGLITERAKQFIPSLSNAQKSKLKENISMISSGKDEAGNALFSGQDYKRNMKRLKNASKDARGEFGDLADFYEEISQVYKQSLTDGMGPTKARAWNDLSERYAMTKLINTNGIDVNGVLNGRKLLDYISNSDIERITRGAGGERVKRIHEVAKMLDIEKKQSHVDFGEGLAGLTDKEKRVQEQINTSKVTTPDLGDTNFVDDFMENRKLTGWVGGPSAMTGLLNLPRDSTSRLTRAAEQSTDSRLGLLNFVMTDEEKEQAIKEAEQRVANGGNYFNTGLEK